MTQPTTPAAWANRITQILQTVEAGTGLGLYPIRVQDVAPDLSRQFFPDAPLTHISGDDLGGRFEGMLVRVPRTTNDWGIIYNTAVKSAGRINFTLAHEFGHYLLHRAELENGEIRCSRQDMHSWDSDYGRRESEANTFASYLLMPRNTFEQLIHGKQISLALLQSVANYFNVSLIAATLKWLQFTTMRAMLVVGDNGFVKWVWSSEKLLKSGVYLQPKKYPIALPSHSLAVSRSPLVIDDEGLVHKAGSWPPFTEDVREMTVLADSYEMTITLLLFPDTRDNRYNRY